MSPFLNRVCSVVCRNTECRAVMLEFSASNPPRTAGRTLVACPRCGRSHDLAPLGERAADLRLMLDLASAPEAAA